MSKSGNQNRINIPDNRKMILFAEVDGICFFCTKSLTYKKSGKVYNFFEIAHIYLLNATPKRKKY